MNVVRGTVLVVATLTVLAISIPLLPFVLLAAGSAVGQGFLIGIFAGAAALVYAIVSVLIKQSAANARLKELAAKAKQRMNSYGFSDEREFAAAGGGWYEANRELLAKSQGFDSFRDYCKFWIKERERGVTIADLQKDRPTFDEIRTIYREQQAAEKAVADAKALARKNALRAKLYGTDQNVTE